MFRRLNWLCLCCLGRLNSVGFGALPLMLGRSKPILTCLFCLWFKIVAMGCFKQHTQQLFPFVINQLTVYSHYWKDNLCAFLCISRTMIDSVYSIFLHYRMNAEGWASFFSLLPRQDTFILRYKIESQKTQKQVIMQIAQ